MGGGLFVLRSLNDINHPNLPTHLVCLLDRIPEIKYISLTTSAVLLLEKHYLDTGVAIFYMYVHNK